jgi:hypothetical protein
MPDDYDWLPGSARFPVSDLGELAVRLGSSVTFDRRGEVLWFDVCDKGLGPYATGGSGLGNAITVESTWPLHGHYALRMTAGSTLLSLSYLRKAITNVSMLRCGLEVAFFLTSPCVNFEIMLLRGTGGMYYQTFLRYDYVLGELQYKGDDALYHSFASVGVLDDLYGIYHHVKLVVDFAIGHYVRAVFDDQEYDLSAHALYSFAGGIVPHYDAWIYLAGRAANNDQATLGHVIVTGNEP